MARCIDILHRELVKRNRKSALCNLDSAYIQRETGLKK